MIITSNKQQQTKDIKNSTLRSTQISFYLQLERSNRKAKQLLHRTFTKQLNDNKAKIYKYDKLSYQKTDRTLKDNKSQNHNKTDNCLNILRDQRHEELFKQELLKNRIIYYDNEKQRCIKTVEEAKRRYSTIMQNRDENLKMKKQLNQNKKYIQKQHRNYVKSLRDKAMLQKEERNKTLQFWKSRKLSQASLIKDMKNSCHKKISIDKSLDYSRKKQMAKSVKVQEQVLYKKTLQTMQSKKKIAVQNHASKVFQEIQKKKYIIKKNKKLMKKVIDKQNEIKSIVQKAHKEIEMYEDAFKFKLFKKRSLSHTSQSESKNKLFITKF